MRFGLGGKKPKTLEEVGLEFDVTRERVRQLQNMALMKMRKAMASKDRQRTAEELEDEKRERQRMQVLQEFFQQKGIEKQAENLSHAVKPLPEETEDE